jgi:hypothetical protein
MSNKPSYFEIQVANQLDRIEAKIEELESKKQWQPIETAPKDESVLLLLENPRNIIEAYMTETGWVDCWCSYVAPYKPTHWMPLPEPPKEKGK